MKDTIENSFGGEFEWKRLLKILSRKQITILYKR